MHPSADPLRNPFATRRVRPGVNSYLFADGQSATELIRLLIAHDRIGQIVGPHGSGKSTLIKTLLPVFEQHFSHVHEFILHDQQRSLPVTRRQMRQWTPSTLVIIDGYEQLSWRWRLRLRVRRHLQRFGLLVTTHRPVWAPVLFRTATSLKQAQRIVRHIAPGDETGIRAADVRAAYERHGSNIREVLFELYDVFRLRHRR